MNNLEFIWFVFIHLALILLWYGYTKRGSEIRFTHHRINVNLQLIQLISAIVGLAKVGEDECCMCDFILGDNLTCEVCVIAVRNK